MDVNLRDVIVADAEMARNHREDGEERLLKRRKKVKRGDEKERNPTVDADGWVVEKRLNGVLDLPQEIRSLETDL